MEDKSIDKHYEDKSIDKHYKVLIATYLSAKEKKIDEYSARRMVTNLLLHFENNFQKKHAIRVIDDLINKLNNNNSLLNCEPSKKCKACFKNDTGCFQEDNNKE
ncbi:MAG: hypothetical protein HOF44_04865 [Pelagibacterales bacterium]|jgi:23S rRNA-/tRNA-specific pseudouridylate synthase|nr:hypothetical protein [Pelagibacterales bacterium]